MQNPEILEIKTDTESVCIPTEEYRSLVHSETLLNVIFSLRNMLSCYHFYDTIKDIETHCFRTVTTQDCGTCKCAEGTVTGSASEEDTDNAGTTGTITDSESHA